MKISLFEISHFSRFTIFFRLVKVYWHDKFFVWNLLPFSWCSGYGIGIKIWRSLVQFLVENFFWYFFFKIVFSKKNTLFMVWYLWKIVSKKLFKLKVNVKAKKTMSNVKFSKFVSKVMFHVGNKISIDKQMLRGS